MAVRQKKLGLPIILAPVFATILVTVFLPLTRASSHKVRFVYDGDTILLYGKGKVRYLGINAPEINHNGGKDEFMAREARIFNFESVGGTRVRLEYGHEKRDRHGRLLAYVFLENGDMINALLVRKGLAISALTRIPSHLILLQ